MSQPTQTKTTSTRYGPMTYYADDPSIGRSLEVYGEYCHPEIEQILSMVNKDTVYLDIGANIGTHSISIAPYVQQVHAWEPDAQNFHLLEINTKPHRNITISHKAISDNKASGYTEFDFGKTKFIEHPGERTRRSKTLDGYNMDKIDFVKLDTEGYEFRILQGMGYTLTNLQPDMLIEMQDETAYSKIYDYLTIFDYYMYWLPVPTFNPNNFKHETVDVFGPQHGVINWICSREKLNTTLQAVVDRDDTVERMVWRRNQNVGYDIKHGE